MKSYLKLYPFSKWLILYFAIGVIADAIPSSINQIIEIILKIVFILPVIYYRLISAMFSTNPALANDIDCFGFCNDLTYLGYLVGFIIFVILVYIFNYIIRSLKSDNNQ